MVPACRVELHAREGIASPYETVDYGLTKMLLDAANGSWRLAGGTMNMVNPLCLGTVASISR